MAETSQQNGHDAADDAQADQPKIEVVGQYIKDLSFENPNFRSILLGRPENPNLEIEVNVNAEKVGDGLYESAIEFGAKAVAKDAVYYELEISYAGLFRIENMPDDTLEPFLLIHCPTLLFPFLRRLISDLTREGGFPPLLLDPIDFASLYQQRHEQASAPQATNQDD